MVMGGLRECLLVLLLLNAADVQGHGAMVNPPPRNLLDRVLPANERLPPQPCDCANTTSGTCDAAQACYWYSQGCSIGCNDCDNSSARLQIDICGSGMNATLPMQYRTINRAAPEGSVQDIYKYNPWRSPGNAPIVDACGMAGGNNYGGSSDGWATYKTTPFARKGDLGSKLPEYPTSTVWKRGTEVETTWQVIANHGGGYQYRLCPGSSPLTEDCFQQHVVPFARRMRLSFDNGTQIPIVNASRFYVSEGTTPAGSTWAMVPLPPRWLGDGGNSSCCDPRNDCAPLAAGEEGTPCGDGPEPNFPPPCAEGPAVHRETGGGRYPSQWFNVSGECSGCQPAGGRGRLPWRVTTLAAITDTLIVPVDIAPGKWVLGWRYDCEATAQIWQNCADITVV